LKETDLLKLRPISNGDKLDKLKQEKESNDNIKENTEKSKILKVEPLKKEIKKSLNQNE
jgi:hypothetical protein